MKFGLIGWYDSDLGALLRKIHRYAEIVDKVRRMNMIEQSKSNKPNYLLPIFSPGLALATGIIVGIHTSEWTWFARSGSVMVALSLLTFGLSFTSTVRHSIQTKNHQHTPPSVTYYLIALYGGVVGTLIWGFGDLIGRFL